MPSLDFIRTDSGKQKHKLESEGFHKKVATLIVDNGVPLNVVYAFGPDRFIQAQLDDRYPSPDLPDMVRNHRDDSEISVELERIGNHGKLSLDEVIVLNMIIESGLRNITQRQNLQQERLQTMNEISAMRGFYLSLDDILGYEHFEQTGFEAIQDSMKQGLIRGREVPEFVSKKVTDLETIAKLQGLGVFIKTFNDYDGIGITELSDKEKLATQRLYPGVITDTYHKADIRDVDTMIELDKTPLDRSGPRSYIQVGVKNGRTMQALNTGDVSPKDIELYKLSGIDGYEDMITSKARKVDGYNAVSYSKAGFHGEKLKMVRLMDAGVKGSEAEELAPYFEGNDDAMITIKQLGISMEFIRGHVGLMDGTRPDTQEKLLDRLVSSYNFEAKPAQPAAK